MLGGDDGDLDRAGVYPFRRTGIVESDGDRNGEGA